MKRQIYFLLFLAVTFVTHAQVRGAISETRQRVADAGEVRFSDASCLVRNDSLFIAFDLTVRGKVISSDKSLHIVPTYHAEDQEWCLPKILINGKKRAKYYNREQALLSHRDYWAQRPFALLTLDGRQAETVSYYIAEPLPVDMRDGGTLDIEQFVGDCCNLRFIATQPVDVQTSYPAPLQSPEITRPVYESSVTFLRPEKEVVKERAEHLMVRINYIVDRYDVLPYYAGNASELQKVDNILRPLSLRSKTYRIKRVSIKGYASPEAPYVYNLRLSQRRADGFKQYLINRYGLYELSHFNAIGLGEDWDGLRRAVENTHIAYRAQVLSIIDNIAVFGGREKMLMDLAGGEPYRYMLRTLFPALRRMEMDIVYTVRSFETEEAAKVIDKRPQDLSQEEIYDLARKRNNERAAQSNRKEYGREYDVAAKYFPDDAIANINAASAALIEGDLQRAYSYLQKVWQEPKALNNIGVYYMLQKDYKQARVFFEKALLVDKQKASANLRLIEEVEKRK